MAGLGAAHYLNEQHHEYSIYDKNAYYGGHAASFFDSGFIFDDGPHVSFTSNNRIKKLFEESVNYKFEEISANVNNFWQGHWIKHPAQCNLFGLPEYLIKKILHEIDGLQSEKITQIRNYKDWLISNFGRTFSMTFPMEYCKKYHTVSADNMSTNWIGPRVYKPDMKEVIDGAFNPETKDVHYVKSFRYPTFGGFVSFLNKFIKSHQILLNHEANKIDFKQKAITFYNNGTKKFDHLISSIPLPQLIKIINDVPSDVKTAVDKLACTTAVIVNIGVDRCQLSEAVWTYFYDSDYIFSRISFPALLSKKMTPHKMGSIQAEIYFSNKYRPLRCKANDLIKPVIRDLKRCGIIMESDKIIFSKSSIINYANIIFDLDREKALKIVHGFLDDIGLAYCGRYGLWGYQWTDESFISGENAARKILKG